MLTPELEQLIQYAIKDGTLTDKERTVLMRKAQESGMDLDEFEMILEGKLLELKANNAPAPKASNNKYGEVRKCPACGAMISAFNARCGECGFEFNNAEANQTATYLFEKLQALEMQKAQDLTKHEEHKSKQLQALSERHNSGGTLVKIFGNSNGHDQDEEREDLIRTLEKGAGQIERKYLTAKINMIKAFAVPNTKGDLLELLSMSSSSAYDNDGVIGPEEEAWIQKTDQIYQKIIICAAGDTATLNQATNMIVSLIKRLPAKYKNFTRIPKELRDKINIELKAQKAEESAEKREKALGILKGWRGIAMAVILVVFLIGLLCEANAIIFVAFIVLAILGVNTYKTIKKTTSDALYE